MSGSWYDLVPNVGKENEDDPDITDTGLFSEVLPAVGQIFKLLAPYRRDKPLIKESQDDSSPGTSNSFLNFQKPDEVEEKQVEAEVKKGDDAQNEKYEPEVVTSNEVVKEDGSQESQEGSLPNDDDDSSSSDDDISTSSESSDTSESEVEDINLASGFTKLDLDGILKSATQRVNLRKLFKPGEYEALCRFEQKRIIRIENKLTLMLRLKLPLPNENIIREKIGLWRTDIAPPESSDSESDDDWGSKKRSGACAEPVFRGISNEDTAARMAFIAKYCEDRQTGKRVVQDQPKRKIAKPTKVRKIIEEKKPSFEAFKTAEPQDGSGDAPEAAGATRYNTRCNSDVKYTEEYVPEDDHFVYCDDCMKMYVDDCPDHPLTIMKDSEAEMGIENYAKRTCPPGLSVDPSSVRNAGYGVWADVAIPKNTVFGPYVGEAIKKYDAKKLVKVCNGGYSWEIYRKDKLIRYVDGSDATVSNWLRYVNCARFEEEQNLLAFQYRGQIYYRAFSDIKPDTELFVWYGSHYASQLGIEEKLKRKHPVQTSGSKSTSTGQSLEKGNVFNNELVPNHIQPCPKVGTPLVQHPLKKNFSSKSCLQTHDEALHEKTSKHQCKQCGKVLVTAQTLKIHMRIHTGEKLYKCDVCGHRSSQLSDLKKHQRIHTGEKPFKCDVCNERFNVRSNLKTHQRTHTGEKPFKCEVCDERFNQLANLRSHQRIHTGEKLYKCDVCGHRSSQLSDLKKHLRIHTGEKPYKCNECGKRFTASSGLRAHEKKCCK